MSTKGAFLGGKALVFRLLILDKRKLTKSEQASRTAEQKSKKQNRANTPGAGSEHRTQSEAGGLASQTGAASRAKHCKADTLSPPFAPPSSQNKYSLLTADPKGGRGGSPAGGKRGDEKGEGEREGEGKNETPKEATKQSPEGGATKGWGATSRIWFRVPIDKYAFFVLLLRSR